MDRKVATAISICCIVVGIVLVCFLQAVSATGMPGFELRAENQHLSLFFHPETTEIAVYDRLTGETWYSNPKDRSARDTSPRFGEGRSSRTTTYLLLYSGGCTAHYE